MGDVALLVQGELLPEAGNCVESTLLPVAPLALQVCDVHLTSEAVHHLLSEQVVDEGSLDRPVIVHELQQNGCYGYVAHCKVLLHSP